MIPGGLAAQRMVLILACAGTILTALGSAAQAQDLEIAAIFWCENEGESLNQEEMAALQACQSSRELILFNCTSCHTFVPIALSQKTREEWEATLTIHRPRVPGLTDPQWDQVLEYLAAHFNPESPPPEIPPELLGGTHQAF